VLGTPIRIQTRAQCSIALLNDAVSDTTGDASSNAAGKQKINNEA